MKTKLFKKVYVRTEADLPKETGYYAVWFANAMNTISVLWYIGHNKNEWKDVSSYLQPTEIEFPSEKEMAIELIARTAKTANSRGNPTYKAGFIDCYHWIKENNKIKEDENRTK